MVNLPIIEAIKNAQEQDSNLILTTISVNKNASMLVICFDKIIKTSVRHGDKKWFSHAEEHVGSLLRH
jgi:hypothetical protein